MEHGDDATREQLRDMVKQRLAEDIPASIANVWMPILMRLDPDEGVDVLERRIAPIEPAAQSEAVNLIGHLFGDRHGSMSVGSGPIDLSVAI